MSERLAFDTEKSAQVVVRSTEGNYLAVKAFLDQGWWLPATDLHPGEDFVEASRRVLTELDTRAELKGILRVSHTVVGRIKAKMCVVFFAFYNEIISVQNSERVKWIDLEGLRRISVSDEGVAGFELVEWAQYIENNGSVMGLRILADESEDPDSSWQFTVVKERQLSNPKELLVSAIKNKNEGAVRNILLSGLNVNYFINKKMLTVLHLACELQSVSIVGFLILAGADPQIVDDQARSSLHYAANISLIILRIILLGIQNTDEKFRAMNIPDCNGYTALQIATENFGPNNVSLLIPSRME